MAKYKLSEIFELQMGKTPDRHNADFWTNGTEPWISIADLSKCGKYIENTAESISEEAVEKSGIKLIPSDTVVMSFKLSIGKVAITPKAMYSNEAIMAFVSKGVIHIEPTYLYYLLMHHDWDAGTNKAVMGKTLNKATLSEITVNVHEPIEQLAIVRVLDKASAIIDARRQQLAELDNLVKARFVELFGEPENNDKRWPVRTLGELCSVGSSKRVYQNEQSSEGVPFWRISDLVCKMDTGTVNSELFIPEEKYSELKQAGLVPITGDILVTSRGTLGRCYIINEEDRFYFQDGMISWLSKYSNGITPLYLQHLFMMPGFRKQIDSMQAGSTVAYLSIAMLKKLQVMVPDMDAQDHFASFVDQTDKSKAAVQKALDEAQTLFDSLMQQYFG